MQITLADKVRELERELAIRRRFYPQWQKAGRMKKVEGDRKIAVMEAILEDYKYKSRPREDENQGTLFEKDPKLSGEDIRARNTDPDTSHEAANWARKKLPMTAFIVLKQFGSGRRFSQRQMERHLEELKYAHNTPRRTMTTLRRNGFLDFVVGDDGKVVEEKELGHIGSEVYEITPLGKTYLLHNTLPNK